jgi:hypothetical protein
MFDVAFIVLGKPVFDIRRKIEAGSWAAERGRRGR